MAKTANIKEIAKPIAAATIETPRSPSIGSSLLPKALSPVCAHTHQQGLPDMLSHFRWNPHREAGLVTYHHFVRIPEQVDR